MKCMPGPLRALSSNYSILPKNRACIISVTMNANFLNMLLFLHDIGSFISYSNHHAHSYYMIKNSELLGFDQKEITFMANIARFHRKKAPRKKDLEVVDLESRERDALRILTTLSA